MPEAKQYTFTNKELLELLVKQADVHEGRWILIANFGFSVGNFGPTNDKMSPGAVTVLNYLGIGRADPTTPEEMSVDASVVNPASIEKRRPSGRSRPGAS